MTLESLGNTTFYSLVNNSGSTADDTPKVLESTPKTTGNIIPTKKIVGATSLAVRPGFPRSPFSVSKIILSISK